MVCGDRNTIVAGGTGVGLLAEESLHSKKLFSLCIRQGPSQLCAVRLPGQAEILNLRAG